MGWNIAHKLALLVFMKAKPKFKLALLEDISICEFNHGRWAYFMRRL